MIAEVVILGARFTMRNLTSNIPDNVARLLKAYALRRRSSESLARLGSAFLLLVGFILFSLAADRFFVFPVVLRWVFLFLSFGAPLAAALSGILALFRWRNGETVAGEIDRVLPGSRDALRSTVNFCVRESASPGGIQSYLFQSTVDKASDLAGESSAVELVPRGPARKRWGGAGLLLLFWGIFALVPSARMGLLLQRFIDPSGNYPRPAFTMIELNRDIIESAVQGDDFAVMAQLFGRVSDPIRCTLHVECGEEKLEILMSPRPNARFEGMIQDVQRPIFYYLTAGDGRTARHRLDVIERPVIAAMHVHYDYPRYTRLPRRSEEVFHREFAGVEGTRVQVELTSSLPIKSSYVEFPDRTLNIRWDRTRHVGTLRFTIERDATFAIRLVADNGADNSREPPCRVRVLPDNPPMVALLGWPEDTSVFPEDILEFGYIVSDDFGIGEVFLRAYGGVTSHEIREYSIPLEDFDSLRLEGTFSIEISELVQGEESALGLELVAVDTKGQQATSPRFELNILSESADHQLAELAEIQDYVLNMRHGPYLPFHEVAEILRRSNGQLTILLDGMEEDTALEGSRREMFTRIQRALGSIALHPLEHPYAVTLMIFHSEYPYLSQRSAEWALGLRNLLKPGDAYQSLLTGIGEMEKPYSALRDLAPILAFQSQMADDLVRALANSLDENRRRLLSVLAEQLMDVDSRVHAVEDGDFRDRLLQRRREYLERIAELAGALGDDAISRPANVLIEAASGLEPGLVQDAALALNDALLAGGMLDGRLGEAVDQCRQKYLSADILRKIIDDGGRERVLDVLAELIRLRRGRQVPEEALLLLLVRLYEAIETEDAERERAAMTAYERFYPWSILHNLHERARLLRYHLDELRIDVGVNRLRPGSPRADAAWQDVREQFLALIRDERAGRFRLTNGDFEEVRKALETLRELSPAFFSWSSGSALQSPSFDQQVERVQMILQDMETALVPHVARGARECLADAPELWADMYINVGREPERFKAEREAIPEEVAWAEERATMLKPGTEEHRTWPFRRGSQPRMHLSRTVSRRMMCHAVAAATLLDLREWSWTMEAENASDAGIQALARMTEYLAYLEEHVYDSIHSLHVNRSEGTYPAYLLAVSRNYEELEPVYRELHDWLSRFKAGAEGELEALEPFTEILARVNRTQRFVQSMSAADRYRDRAEAVARAADAESRRGLFLALSEQSEASAYWDRVYLAVWELKRMGEDALRHLREDPPSGMSDERLRMAERTAERITWLLPEGDGIPAEAESIAENLAEWSIFMPRLAAERVAGDANATFLGEELEEWIGRLRATLQGLDERVTVVPPRVQTRRRYTEAARADFGRVQGRMIRSEQRWAERTHNAVRRQDSRYARFLSGDGEPPPDWSDVAWAFSFSQRVRRKSAAASLQRGRGLGLEETGVDERFLNMPKYLFDELMRASRRPYPSQFKDSGLFYMRKLMEDAR